MEDKVLLNTLKAIGTGKEYWTSPDREYLNALEKIGLIKMGYDQNELTKLGREIEKYPPTGNFARCRTAPW